LFWLLQ